jgi:tetratricopeptide (TPR) repeat protein
MQRCLFGINRHLFDAFWFLGACFMRLGRNIDASEQFSKALRLNPRDAVALFNQGLVLQEQNRWEEAIALYRNVTAITQEEASFSSSQASGNSLTADARVQSKIRECDLLQALSRFKQAKDCWKEGARLFPNSSSMHSELGNILATVSNLLPVD